MWSTALFLCLVSRIKLTFSYIFLCWYMFSCVLEDTKILLLKKKWFHPLNLCFVLLFPFYNKGNIHVSTFVFCRNEALDEICFKVCACNTVRDILEGRPIGVQFNQLFLRPNKEKIDFLLEVRHLFSCGDRPLLCFPCLSWALLCLRPFFSVTVSTVVTNWAAAASSAPPPSPPPPPPPHPSSSSPPRCPPLSLFLPPSSSSSSSLLFILLPFSSSSFSSTSYCFSPPLPPPPSSFSSAPSPFF